MNITPSARAQIITRRTYNRPLDEDGTVFETWAQTVDRVVRHQKWLWERAQKRAITFAQGEELEELRELLMERKGLMAGRTLWLGGTDIAKRRMASQLNCSFKRVATVHDVVDIFWLLLQGAGTGFEAVPGTLNGFSRKLDVQIIRSTRTLEQWAAGERGDPMNREFVTADTWAIRVGDSAEAWAKAVGKIMAGKASVNTLILDLREIRASGVRLKGYGWVSSGDGPLSKALAGICEVMNRRAGQLLNRIDLLDVLNWLGTTLSSRRSAQIALCPAHDAEADQFASAKKDYWTTGNIQRGQSNNSLVFWHKPSKHELRGIFQAMIDAGGSEPGFINGAAAQKRAPWFAGVNPCLTYESLVLTSEGLQRIGNLAGRQFEVLNANGDFAPATAWSTGVKPVFKVTLANGQTLRATGDHRVEVMTAAGDPRTTGYKVPAERRIDELAVGDKMSTMLGVGEWGGHEPCSIEEATLAGYLYGDGYRCQHYVETVNNEPEVQEFLQRVCGDKLQALRDRPGHFRILDAKDWLSGLGLFLAPMPERGFPETVLAWSSALQKAFLKGLFSANGAAQPKHNRISLKTTSKHMAEGLQNVLIAHGFAAYLTVNKPTAIEWANGTYTSKTSYDVNIGSAAGYTRFQSSVGFLHAHKSLPCLRDATVDRPPKCSAVVAIEADGEEEVFDFNEPITNWGWVNGLKVHNCAEQLLGDGGVCNLSEIVLPKFNGDPAGLLRAAHVVARANYRQTCIDMRDGVLQHTWHELNEFLHLCGVGVTGVVQWDQSKDPIAWALLADAVRRAAHSMAEELGLPYPKHVTTVKPSGTLSKIADVSEGVHAPLGRFIFNNVSFGLHDPLIPHLKAAGYFMQLNPLDPSSMLVRLPTEYPGAPLVNTESAIDQLERYKLLMENYVDSNCSVTISYDPSEAKAIVDWLHANWDTYVGVSFIYRNDPTKTAADLGYAYLPQEVVTEEVFRAYADSLLPIDVENLGGGDLVDEGCASGACPIR